MEKERRFFLIVVVFVILTLACSGSFDLGGNWFGKEAEKTPPGQEKTKSPTEVPDEKDLSDPEEVREPDSGSEVRINSLTPNEVEIGDDIGLIIDGFGFQEGLEVVFEGGDGPPPTVVSVVVMDDETIAVKISIKSGGAKKERFWDVKVINPDGSAAILKEGLTIVP